MNFTDSKVTEIYCLADDFCKAFTLALSAITLGNKTKKDAVLSHSEVITIMIVFHDKGYRNMKHFYTQYVQKHLTHLCYFPKRSIILLASFLHSLQISNWACQSFFFIEKK